MSLRKFCVCIVECSLYSTDFHSYPTADSSPISNGERSSLVHAKFPLPPLAILYCVLVLHHHNQRSQQPKSIPDSIVVTWEYRLSVLPSSSILFYFFLFSEPETNFHRFEMAVGQQQQEQQQVDKGGLNFTRQGHERSQTLPNFQDTSFKQLWSNSGATGASVPFAVRLHRRLNSNSFKTDPDSLASMPFF